MSGIKKNITLSRYQITLIGLVSVLLISLAVPSTIEDVFFPGTQDGESGNFETPGKCDNCHSYDLDIEPSFSWAGGMMAQAQRDPLYLACLTICNQDVPDVGDLCLRCHTPEGWLAGRSVPTDGTGLLTTDMEGIHCDICHKMVKPTAIGVNPYPDDPIYTDNTYSIDQAYLQTLSSLPPTSGNGMFIVSSGNEKRGPFSDAGAKHSFLYSPFHKESALCGTCHDVSNPVYLRNPDDTYTANTFGEPSPTFNTYELFPVERTYSEWLMSEYNSETGVYAPQMGGNKTYVSTCQDCHMRDMSGVGANKSSAVYRDDQPFHDLTGGNTFIPILIKQTHPGDVNAAALDSGIVRAEYMLKNAATLDLSVTNSGDSLTASVRVTNETGHKLPSGYPEGRRIWINIIARDISNQVVYESGNYNFGTGVLTKDSDAKIYEIKPGLDSTIASITGFPEGPSFHFVLNNIIYFDNRIPPRGFTNSAFETIQSPPVGYSYADGQYWDDTEYTLPPSTANVEVILYYQTVSKEYVEFLRDENVTNNAGQIMYDLWNSNGKSAPVVMNTVSVYVEADTDGDGVPDINDNCPDDANPAQTDNDVDGYGVPCDCDDNDNSVTSGGTWYADSDKDGYGDLAVAAVACTAPSGYVADNTDCDDNDNTVTSGGTWYSDSDNDGYGDPAVSAVACTAPSGYVADNTDCDDKDNTVTTGGTWYADSDNDGYGDPAVSAVTCTAPSGYVADNTDCDDNDNSVTSGGTWYADSDNDGYGDPAVSAVACTAPSGYVANNTDCDDNDNSVTSGGTWYADSDNDGYGDPAVSAVACTAPSGYVADNTDCDDNDNSVTSGGTWYADSDNDGYGDPAVSAVACTAPSGYVADNTDCDDKDNTVTSGGTWYADSDNDGYGDPAVPAVACTAPSGYVADNTDCDDKDNTVTSGGTWYADSDNDGYGDPAVSAVACTAPSGYVADNTDCDDNDNSVTSGGTWYADSDNDGYGDPAVSIVACTAPSGYVADNTDCDDNDNSVTSGGTWYADSDNDGYGDPAVSAVACTAPSGYVADNTDCDDNDNTVTSGGTWYADSDNDGYGDPAVAAVACTAPSGYVADNTDCDDNDNSVTSGGTWYADSDNDGYGNPAVAAVACTAPSGYVADNTDCDDNDNSVTSGGTWYADSDNDGYGNPAVAAVACTAPSGYVADNTDCDDNDNSVTSGGTWYADSDNDGYGDPAVSAVACTAPSGYVADNTDCDDNDLGIYPGAPGLPDGKDNNCDGIVDKVTQTISFSDISDVLENVTTLNLAATATSGLDINFQVIEGNVEISGSVLSINGPGNVKIMAQQEGNDGYYPADPITQEFCVLPLKPAIIETIAVDKVNLRSTSDIGNMWFMDGNLLTDKTGPSINVVESGSYTVQVGYGDCISEFSDPVIVELTGITGFTENDFSIYPNPAANSLTIRVPASMQQSELYLNVVDIHGRYLIRAQKMELLNGDIYLDISQFSSGTYSFIIEDRTLNRIFRGQYIIQR